MILNLTELAEKFDPDKQMYKKEDTPLWETVLKNADRIYEKNPFLEHLKNAHMHDAQMNSAVTVSVETDRRMHDVVKTEAKGYIKDGVGVGGDTYHINVYPQTGDPDAIAESTALAIERMKERRNAAGG